MKNTFSLVLILALSVVTEIANADFTFGKPNNLGPVINSSSTDDAPFISADGLSLYIYSNRPGGSGDWDLWMTTRETMHEDWIAPVNLGQTVNSLSREAGPCISANGLEVYYTSNRGGTYNLWVSTRATVSDSWGEPVNLGQTVNSSSIDAGPHLSPDELSLFFHSTRPGGYGGFDIWVTTRVSIGESWGEPINLGPTVNSSSHDQGPGISADELRFVFSSDRPGGFGERDLYLTTRAIKNDPWEEPVNLGPSVNTAAHDYLPFISPDGSTLYFSSNRSGGVGGYDLWQAPIQPIVDFNGDGVVDVADISIMLDHWHLDEPLYDIAPLPFGDSFVDVQDLIVLSEHLLPIFPAHWELDEIEGSVAYDSVGDHDSTLNGNPLWNPVDGKVNGSLQLDGIDDYINTPYILDTGDGSFSAFAWILALSGEPGQVIISQTNGFGWGGSWLCADSSNGKLATFLMDPQPALVSESVITDGAWHHIGLVWDGSYRYLYVDGAEVARDAAALSYAMPCDGGLNIGAGKTLDAGSFFNGLIDDVRIYNKALSVEEIEELVR
jgi:hypothetical protein